MEPLENREEMTEDFEFGQYVHALTSSSNRVRYLIFAFVITTVVVFAGYRHGSQTGWTNSRVALMRDALVEDLWSAEAQRRLNGCAAEVEAGAPKWPGLGGRAQEIERITRKWGFKADNCWGLKYAVSKLNLRSQEDVKAWLDKIEQAQIDEIIVMQMPFLGTPFDVNDLGIFSGLIYTVLMWTLVFAMARQHENLYLSMWKVRQLAQETGQAPQGRANLLYHALSMSQLFTTPPTLARWKTGATDIIPRLLFWLPVLMQLVILANDFSTYDRGSMVNEKAAAAGWWFELFTFSAIVVAATICTLYSRAGDHQWQKTFRSINPQYDFKIQPSWPEWMKIKKKALDPSWGVAVHQGRERLFVYIADFWGGKVWRIEDPGLADPYVVVNRRCRELLVDSNGNLVGEHIPVDPPSKKWSYSVWTLAMDSAGAEPIDEVPPTPRPPLGRGVLRDSQGRTYAIDGRRPGQAQALMRYANGRSESLAGGLRGVRDGKGTEVGFEWIQDICIDGDSIYLTDGGCVRKVASDGTVSTIGGHPLGGKRRYRRCRLLGIALTPKYIFAADYDFRHVWEIPRLDEGEIVPRVRWETSRFWSPAGLSCSGNHLYILEHRPNTLLGRVLRWKGPWSRVRKVNLAAPEAEPVVLATIGRRAKHCRKPVAVPSADSAPA